MNKAVKLWERYSMASLLEGRQDDKGGLFLSELGQVDLSGVRVLHHGLDTVRQLFKGFLVPSVVADIESLYLQGFGECIELGGHVWVVGSGGASGYQFRLQNSDLGLIIFLKSRYAELVDSGSHLKIEASPHWIVERSSEEMKRDFDRLAACFFSRFEMAGVSVHMCCDVQGWEPPANFSDSLVTRARRMVSHEGGNVVYMDLGEVALRFNRGQSYQFGSASSVQMAVYRKDLQAKATDKLDFWRSRWLTQRDDELNPFYVEGQPVWRVEVRFHHSVIQDFSRGYASQLENGFSIVEGIWSGIAGISEHLQGLWKYGLESFRLEMTQGTKRYLAPFWQFLLQDVIFSNPKGDFVYLRVKKTPGLGNEKNLMLAVGNLMSVYARNRFTAQYAFECLKKSGIYDDLYNYFAIRSARRALNITDSDIFQFVEKALQLRTLYGKAA